MAGVPSEPPSALERRGAGRDSIRLDGEKGQKQVSIYWGSELSSRGEASSPVWFTRIYRSTLLG